MVVGKVGRTVAAYRSGQIETGIVIPVDPREDRKLTGGGGRRTGAVSLLVLHRIHVVPLHFIVHVAAAGQGKVVRSELISRHTRHHVYVVLAELHLVSGGILRRERVLVVFGPVRISSLVFTFDRQCSGIVAIGMTLVEIIGEYAADFQVLNRSGYRREVVGHRMTLQIMGIHIYERTRSINPCSGIVIVVESVFRLHVGIQVNRALIP